MPSRVGQPISVEQEMACLLFDAPNDFVHDRLATALMQAGGKLQQGELGLEMSCRDIDWKAALRTASQSLSAPERHDIRVTVVCDEGAIAMRQAIFGTRRLDEILSELSAEWLRPILDRDQLTIHFQPLIQQPPGRLHGYECLARGIDDAGNLLPPAELFDAARNLGLLGQLDEKCRLLALKRAAESGLLDGQLFINFHPQAIYNPQTCFRITLEAIEAAGINPRHITFEATRSDEVRDRRHLAASLRFLQSQGFKIALDGVGAASACLLELAELRPDYLRLDGDWVRRAAQSAADAKALRELAEVARQHGIIAVAQGVETEQELKFVFSMGIRMTQGFFHGPPNPQPETAEKLKEIIARSRHAYDPGAGKAGETPWDISGLYEKLTTMAHPVPSPEAAPTELHS